MARILLGLFFVVIGGVFVYYSLQMVKLFGRIRWAEEYLGGTREFYILIGFVSIILGFLVLFGVVDISNAPSTSVVVDIDG